MASPTARAKYTRQFITMLDDETADRIAADAEKFGLSKSEVGRTYIEAGIQEADELDGMVAEAQAD